MRELTKSFMHCSWALSVFGAHQLRNVALRGSALQMQEFAEALDNITEAACRDLTPREMAAYRIGVNIQDSFVDLMFKGAGWFRDALPLPVAAASPKRAHSSTAAGTHPLTTLEGAWPDLLQTMRPQMPAAGVPAALAPSRSLAPMAGVGVER